MMAVVKGGRSTKIQMLIYALLLVPIAVAPAILGYASLSYGAIAFILSAFFVYTAIKVLQDRELEQTNFKTAR